MAFASLAGARDGGARTRAPASHRAGCAGLSPARTRPQGRARRGWVLDRTTGRRALGKGGPGLAVLPRHDYVHWRHRAAPGCPRVPRRASPADVTHRCGRAGAVASQRIDAPGTHGPTDARARAARTADAAGPYRAP